MSRTARLWLSVALATAACSARAPVVSAAVKSAAKATTTSVSETTTTTTFTPPTLPTAPAGFADQVVDVYAASSAAAQVLGQSDLVIPLSDFRQQVAAMTPDAMNALYSATKGQPAWKQIPALMQAIAADAAVGASTAAAPRAGARPAAAVGPVVPANCSSGPPASAIFAAQIVIDVSQGVFNVLVNLASVLASIEIAKPVAAAFAVAAAVASVVIAVAQVVHDALGYAQGAAGDCAAGNQDRSLANIESTTTQLYSLDTQVSLAVADLQSTVGTTQATAQQMATGLTALKATLRQALVSSADLKAAIGGDTQAIAAQIDADQAAMRANLAALGDLETANRQGVEAKLSDETTAVQAAITSDLQLALEEIDSAAATLAGQFSGMINRAVALAGSTRSATDAAFEAGLRLRVEAALAADVPGVQFRLPAAQGGLLDALPVGVQSVVAGDVRDLDRLGMPVTKNVRRMLKRAASDLAAHRYDAAFADLRGAYQDLNHG